MNTQRIVMSTLFLFLLLIGGCADPPPSPSPAAPTATEGNRPSPTVAAPTATPEPDPTAAPSPTPTPPPTPLPAPPTPGELVYAKTPFELGGHIRTWEHTAKMRHAGMTWAKAQVYYGSSDAGELIAAAHDRGFKIQLTALGEPSRLADAAFAADYVAWLAELAAAGTDAIEVWNEPNIPRDWPAGQIDPAAYTALLCRAYAAIKAANPETAVISAAPAPTGYFGGCTSEGCDDLPFLEGMVAAGAAGCLDYVGAHYNAGATSPAARRGHPAGPGSTHPSWYFLPQTERYYALFGGERQLFYTELGYAAQEGVAAFSEHFAWARETSAVQQADWLRGAVNLARHTGMVHAIMIWNVDFPRYGLDPQDGYAIVRPGGSCPACDALHETLSPARTIPVEEETRRNLPWQAGEEHCVAIWRAPLPTGLYVVMDREPVLAAHGGRVAMAAWADNYGYFVLLCPENGQSCTFYGHLDAVTVAAGQYVERGREIGLSGTTGAATGPVLRFATLEKGTGLRKLNEEPPTDFVEVTALEDGGCYVSQNNP